MAVSVVTSAEQPLSAVDTNSFSIDATGGDCLFLAMMWRHNASQVLSSVTYAGGAATLLADNFTARVHVAAYYVLAPTSGSNTVSVTWSANCENYVVAVVLSGVSQTVPCGTPIQTADAGGSATSITSGTITGDASGIYLDVVAIGSADTSNETPGGSQTLIQVDTTSVQMAGGVSWKAGAPTTTMGWTWTTGAWVEHLGVAVLPAAAVAGAPFRVGGPQSVRHVLPAYGERE